MLYFSEFIYHFLIAWLSFTQKFGTMNYYCMIANFYPVFYILVKTYTILEYLNVNKRLSFFRLWPSQKKRNNPSNAGYIIFCNVPNLHTRWSRKEDILFFILTSLKVDYVI